jgi:hypothetical protein
VITGSCENTCTDMQAMHAAAPLLRTVKDNGKYQHISSTTMLETDDHRIVPFISKMMV